MNVLKSFSFLAILLFCLCSCRDDEPVLFPLSFEENFTVPAGLNTFTIHVFSLRDIPTFYSQQIQNLASDEEVSSILPGRASLNALFSNIDFSVIEEVIVYVTDSNDSDDRREVFFRQDIPFNTDDQLLLFASLSEVIDILENDTIDIELEFDFDLSHNKPWT